MWSVALSRLAVPTTVDGGLLGKWVKYNEIFFIYTFFSSTHLQVRRDDGFSRFIAQTTRIYARMCLLAVSLTLLPILGVKYPKNLNFWAVNRRFQAKRAKYSSRVVPIGAQQIQDGGRPPFWKKTVKSLYLCNRLTDCDKIWYSDAYWPLTADIPLKYRIFENPKWRRPPSWKITKIAISP